ncbi:type I-E CRISPR-associated protein Cse2/CasB [Corynebacterium sp. ES2794-CONJ1]|uniref:type I-E CRISPR-associated protein Cse2/CasB n=1 Tax=Corynebacterium sp. ES2794-CONJ1 TaxID=2980553 RepID=UPI0021D98A67|nr:type I-E CRISPR-associated protein Cse2/CasB [Corynebacterium sp. ES2794-CONJ1]MCU9519966.1 type I-E CRISPR-associated protein Cse2/CasB [Corynebacterium sp. ES2794-CONJ1]
MATQADQVSTFVYRTVERLQKKYLEGSPSAKADLASWRRSASKTVGESPETWAVLAENFPESLVGRGQHPSAAEQAVFTALTLFAVHMQSKTRPMHVKDNGLGTAMRTLARTNEADFFESSLFRRFTSATQAQTVEAASYHLRTLVSLLRSKDIPLDYGRLARELYLFQFPDSRKAVQLGWARQIYRFTNPES